MIAGWSRNQNVAQKLGIWKCAFIILTKFDFILGLMWWFTYCCKVCMVLYWWCLSRCELLIPEALMHPNIIREVRIWTEVRWFFWHPWLPERVLNFDTSDHRKIFLFSVRSREDSCISRWLLLFTDLLQPRNQNRFNAFCFVFKEWKSCATKTKVILDSGLAQI